MRLTTSVLTFLVPALASASTHIQVKGSDTIGENLGQAFAASYEAAHPGTSIEWESLGSGTAFVGLFDGSAQIGASSRSIQSKELEEARSRGIELEESVLGYDGIAVICHPSNPIAKLTVAQLSELFQGHVASWRELGGADLPIHLLSRPSYSGTHGFFKEKVLRLGDKKGSQEFGPTVQFVEETSEIVKRVTEDPGAISYVGLGFVTEAVRTVPVAAKEGEEGVSASSTTVRDGTYPIYRPLLVYIPKNAGAEVRDFVGFMLSATGQALVEKAEFVRSEVTAFAGAAPAGGGSGSGSPVLEPVRVQFPSGGALLDTAARERLASVAARAKEGRFRLIISGHADGSGPRAANDRVARRRADAAALFLKGAGVPAEACTVESFGPDQPVASNDTLEGRSSNRRVDVQLVPAT